MIELAKNVSEYIIKQMQHEKGYFYFRKFKLYSIKTSFMRWSNAWMFVAFHTNLFSKYMKYLFYLGHPAHFHLFKNIILKLQNENKIFVLYKTKDVIKDLLEDFKVENINI